jgi:hypothetical protein
MDLLFPAKGFHKGLGAEKQPAGTTPWIQNMRVIDTQDNRFRGGQRPGLKKAYTQQIGGDTAPVVWIGAITIVD